MLVAFFIKVTAMAKRAKKIYAQKHFIDGANNRVHKGEEIKPDQYDSVTLKHYERYGMIGSDKPVVAPSIVKPAAPKNAKPVKAVEGDSGSPDQNNTANSDENKQAPLNESDSADGDADSASHKEAE